MPTVAVLAELIIAGVQATVWSYLLVCLVLGWNWLSFESNGAGATVQTMLVLALAYTLGVIIDRLADSLLTTIDKRLGTPAPVAPEQMRLRILLHGGEAATYLSYMRSRLRVARSTVFNLGLTVLALALLAVAGPTGGPSRQLLMAATAAAAAAAAVSFWVARRIGKTYDDRLSQADRELSSLKAALR